MQFFGIFLFAVGSYVSLAPETLSAAHTVHVWAINNANIVETVVPEIETASAPVEVAVQNKVATSNAASVRLAAAPAEVQTAATPVAPVAYAVTRQIGSLDEYIATALNLSYSDIYQFKRMVYGHNSANLLGNLRERYVGEEVTVNGVRYRVADKATYAKTADGNLEGNATLMSKIAYTAMGHSLAMLTCAGQSYGNGDASHRLVVYLDQI